MNTILVPTDFSEAAYNAFEYALQIAQKTKAKIVLLNVYNYPAIPTEAPMVIPMQDLEKQSLKALEHFADRIRKKNTFDIPIELQCKCGYPVNEIDEFSKKHHINLIVIGMSGAGFMNEKIIGSTTTSLIRTSKCPILVIEKNTSYKKIKKMALASDLQTLKNGQILKPILEMAKLFDSQIQIVHVSKEKETADFIKNTEAGKHLDHFFTDIQHSFHNITEEDVTEGIEKFIKRNKIDMIITIPRVHSVWNTLLQEPQTKRMAFHIQTPILALHE